MYRKPRLRPIRASPSTPLSPAPSPSRRTWYSSPRPTAPIPAATSAPPPSSPPFAFTPADFPTLTPQPPPLVPTPLPPARTPLWPPSRSVAGPAAPPPTSAPPSAPKPATPPPNRRQPRAFSALLGPTATRVVDRLGHAQATDRKLARLATEEWDATVRDLENKLRPGQPPQVDQLRKLHIDGVIERARGLLALRGPLPPPPPADARSLVALHLPETTTTASLTSRLTPALGIAARAYVRRGRRFLFAIVRLPSVTARDNALAPTRKALRLVAPNTVVRRARTRQQRQFDTRWRRWRARTTTAGPTTTTTTTTNPSGVALTNRFAGLHDEGDDDNGDDNPASPPDSPALPPSPSPPSSAPTTPPPPKRGAHHATNGNFDHLLVGTWNARGLRDPLKVAALTAQLLETTPLDVLAVQETWLAPGQTVSVPNYTWFGRPRPRQDHPSGGVGFLVADRLAHRFRVLSGTTDVDDDEPHPTEALWAKLELAGAATPVILCSLYWPPATTQSTARITAYLEQLERDLDTYRPNGDVVLLGDLNSHLGAGASDNDIIGRHHHPEQNAWGTATRPLLERLDLTALNGRTPHAHTANQPCLECCTFYTARENGFANDYILVERHIDLTRCHCRVDAAAAIGNSDHRPVLARIPVAQRHAAPGPPMPPAQPRAPRYAVRRLDRTKEEAADVRAALQAALADELDNTIDDSDDPNVRWAALLAAIRHAADRTVGRLNPNPNRATRTRVPWWDGELRRAAQERSRLQVTCSRTHNAADLARLTAARKLGKELAEGKRKAWETQRDQRIGEVLDAEGLSKGLWRAIADLTPRATQRIPGVRGPDGTLDDSDAAINLRFRVHFAQLDTNPGPAGYYDAATKTDIEAKLASYITAENAHATAETNTNPITLVEVKMALQALTTGTAAGPDGLDPVLIKDGGDALVAALHELLQLTWRSERVPADWQMGEIVPLHKTGDRTDPGNYRGITLQPVALKVLCQVLLTRLQAILDPADPTAPGCSPLADEQAGFRRGRGCLDHAFLLKAAIDDARHRRAPLLIAFLDLRKAYDTVWRDGLWWKLHEHGVRGKLWRMLRALYSSVEARVRTNDMLSPPITLNNGVRQGCVLSPMLFDVYIDDLVADLRTCGAGIHLGGRRIPGLLFADDVALVASSPASMAKALACVDRWCRKWRMSLNLDKCKAMIIKPPSTRDLTFPPFNGHQLEMVHTFKYLGIELSSDGSWNAAVDARIKATGRATSRLIPVLCNQHLPAPVRITLWSALARSKLDYGAELIEPSEAEAVRLSRCVWRAGKLIMGVGSSCLTRALEADLGLLSYADRADHLKLRWRTRIAARHARELTRTIWTGATSGQLSSSTVDAIEALVFIRGLRPHITRIEGGDRTKLAETLVAAHDAVLAHRSGRLRTPPASASATIDHAFHPLLDLATPGKCLPWLRQRGTTTPARLRFTLRAGTAPLIIQLGRYRGLLPAERWCRFCNSTAAVEDAEHFVLHCPCWANARQHLNELVDDMLAAPTFKPYAAAAPITAAAWLRTLSAARQTQLLLGAPVPGVAGTGATTTTTTTTTTPSPWTETQAHQITEALTTIFNRGVWAMWGARLAKIASFGEQGIPFPHHRPGRWSAQRTARAAGSAGSVQGRGGARGRGAGSASGNVRVGGAGTNANTRSPVRSGATGPANAGSAGGARPGASAAGSASG